MSLTTNSLTDATTRSTTREALRWMVSFLGFPAGGLATRLIVGHIDSVAAAVAGGALSGAILGLVQAAALRQHGSAGRNWIVVTAAGFCIGLAAGASTVGYATDRSSLATQGAITGLAVGLAQAVALWRRLGRLAVIWPALLSGLWALGWTITSSAGIDVDSQYSVFGSSGAIVVTAITAVLPLALSRRPRPAVVR